MISRPLYRAVRRKNQAYMLSCMYAFLQVTYSILLQKLNAAFQKSSPQPALQSTQNLSPLPHLSTASTNSIPFELKRAEIKKYDTVNDRMLEITSSKYDLLCTRNVETLNETLS